jgi:hypothetical protein
MQKLDYKMRADKSFSGCVTAVAITIAPRCVLGGIAKRLCSMNTVERMMWRTCMPSMHLSFLAAAINPLLTIPANALGWENTCGACCAEQ